MFLTVYTRMFLIYLTSANMSHTNGFYSTPYQIWFLLVLKPASPVFFYLEDPLTKDPGLILPKPVSQCTLLIMNYIQ